MSEAPLWFAPPKVKGEPSRSGDSDATSTAAPPAPSSQPALETVVDSGAVERAVPPPLPPLRPQHTPQPIQSHTQFPPPPSSWGPAPRVDPFTKHEPVSDPEHTGRRRPRRRTIALAIIVMIGVGFVTVEAVGRRMIEGIAERQIRTSGVAGDVEVTVGTGWWSPTITRLFITRHLSRVDVELRSAQMLMLPIEEASYRLNNLNVSFSVRHRTVRVNSLRSGKVLVVVDPTKMSDLLGITVKVRSGELYLGDSVEPAAVEVVGTELVITSPVLAFINGTDQAAFPVVDPYLLPCEPSAKLRGSFIELKCTGSELPGILGQTIGLDEGETGGDSGVPPDIGTSNSTVLEPQPTDPSAVETPGPATTIPTRSRRPSKVKRRSSSVTPGGPVESVPTTTVVPDGSPGSPPPSSTVVPHGSIGSAPSTSTATSGGSPTTAPSSPSTGPPSGSPTTVVSPTPQPIEAGG